MIGYHLEYSLGLARAWVLYSINDDVMFHCRFCLVMLCADHSNGPIT